MQGRSFFLRFSLSGPFRPGLDAEACLLFSFIAD